MFKLFLLLLAFVPTVHAAEWTSDDTNREVAYQVIQDIDWLQTRNIAKSPCFVLVKHHFGPYGQYYYDKVPGPIYEQNNYLGPHPSMGAVNRYFLVMSVVHLGISYLLPREYRAPFQYITIGMESGYVAHNLSVGIHITF